MTEISLTSEQLPHINPTAETQRLRREHLRQIGDLAVRDLDPNEDEALIERTREFAIMKEIREFAQTTFITEPITIIEQDVVRVLPEQLAVVRELLVSFIEDGIVLNDQFLETVHSDAEIDREVLDVVVDVLRQEGLLTHTANGYVKSPTGDDHKAWLDATITGPINVIRSNN